MKKLQTSYQGRLTFMAPLHQTPSRLIAFLFATRARDSNRVSLLAAYNASTAKAFINSSVNFSTLNPIKLLCQSCKKIVYGVLRRFSPITSRVKESLIKQITDLTRTKLIKLLCQGHPTTVFSQMLFNAVLGHLEYF